LTIHPEKVLSAIIESTEKKPVEQIVGSAFPNREIYFSKGLTYWQALPTLFCELGYALNEGN